MRGSPPEPLTALLFCAACIPCVICYDFYPLFGCPHAATSNDLMIHASLAWQA